MWSDDVITVIVVDQLVDKWSLWYDKLPENTGNLHMIKTIVTAIATVVVLFIVIVVANQLVVGKPNLIQSIASALIAGIIVGILGIRKKKHS